MTRSAQPATISSKHPRNSLSPQTNQKKTKTIIIDSEGEPEPDSNSMGTSKGDSQANSQNKSGAKSSWVWHYFIEHKTKYKHVLICQAKVNPGSNDLCLTELARDKTSSTKSMIRHLSKKHGITATDVREESAINMEKYAKERRICPVCYSLLLLIQCLLFELTNLS